MVIARENGGPKMLMQENAMDKMKVLMNTEKDTDLLQSGARILSCLTLDSKLWVSWFSTCS